MPPSATQLLQRHQYYLPLQLAGSCIDRVCHGVRMAHGHATTAGGRCLDQCYLSITPVTDNQTLHMPLIRHAQPRNSCTPGPQ